MKTHKHNERNIAAADYFNRVAGTAIIQQCGDQFGTAIPAKEWQAKIIYGLAEHLLNEYRELGKAYNERRTLSSLAFHARNLLELMIWVSYCLENERNLRTFFEDAGKDAGDILGIFEKSSISAVELASLDINGARNKLQESAKKHGVENIEGNYQHVGRIAAQHPQLSSYYKIHHKMLSKCTHPTALTILGLPDSAANQLRDHFFDVGCFCFSVAIRPLALKIGIEVLDPLCEVSCG